MKLITILAASAAVALAACGDDDKTQDAGKSTSTEAASSLSAIKGYLLEHTTRLVKDTGTLRADADAYYALAESADFDYKRLLDEQREQTAGLVTKLQADMQAANPAYEEMEGVVAGVPSLADYDVIIDAGSDASDPESAVPFSIETKAGKEYKQPGNFFALVETSVFGTEPKYTAKGVEADLNGDGEVKFPEALPDADFLQAVATDFEKQAISLDADAKKWEPTNADALTAIVVMTPTMSEYFGAWKNSRFVAGDKATEKGFVGASRTQDIADILGGIALIYDNVEPVIAGDDPEQAKQTGTELKQLLAFAEKVRDEEADGKRFTASDADTLGTEAQRRAEAIAGQVSQTAGKLGIEIES
ncbi:MAG TPA: hypothetical protein VNT22_03880 [Baekduia sp.]|nr:hypothetical protein [Baekduia sp.]